MRPASLLASLAFAWFASLQLNDPDPVVWVAVYGGAAASCAWLGSGRPAPWTFCAFYSLACLGWAATLGVRVVAGGTPWAEVLDLRQGMLSVGIEEGREAMGLLIVSGWMAALAVWRRRAVAPPLAAAPHP